MLTTRKRPNALQAILLTINGLLGFVFKTKVYLKICEKMRQSLF